MLNSTTYPAKKVFRNLLPWCVTFYVASYVDRVNVGFAALTMNNQLGLSATSFGFANTIFYCCYVLFEVPSTLLLQRYGARVWIPRIIATWGLASAATAMAVGVKSFVVLRALVGIAEAGLTPGLIYYLSLWFPPELRVKANTYFLMSLPLALLVGTPISGVLSLLDGKCGLAGWQWIFVGEGAISIVLAIIAGMVLRNRPTEVAWLTRAEKDHIESLDLGGVAPREGPFLSRLKSFDIVSIIVPSLIYFAIQANSNTLGIWTPLLVHEVVRPTAGAAAIAVWSAVPAGCALIAMVWVSGMKPKLSVGAFAMLLAAMGWSAVALSTNVSFRLFGLSIAYCGVYSSMAMFWAAVSSLFNVRRRALAIGAISGIGTLGSVVSPYIIGYLRTTTASFTAGIWYVAVLIAAGGALLLLATRQDIRGQSERSQTEEAG